MARLSRPKCDRAVLLGSVKIVSARIISLFFFCSAAVNRDQGHEFVRNMLAEYTSSIFILSEGCDCNTGTGEAPNIAPEHDFVDGSDFSAVTEATNSIVSKGYSPHVTLVYRRCVRAHIY